MKIFQRQYLGMFVISVALWSGILVPSAFAKGKDFGSYLWTLTNPDAGWEPRAGLQVVEHNNRLFLMGGRTPVNPADLPFPVPGASVIWGDVWRSDDWGVSWTQLLPTNDDLRWPPRAYFQGLVKNGHIWVLGGQNFDVVENPCPPLPPGVECPPPFVSTSEFFNDVWRSRDGINWEQMTDNAGWAGRAGLSAVEHRGAIFVMGGSFNDDPSIIGGPPERVYFNDVWKSYDGVEWQLVTDSAPWAPRAGAQVVTKNGFIYLIGGEDGFTCDSGSERCPPYFNDVWRSRDGATWELVTESAPWPERPGHQVVVILNRFVLFGGFGLNAENPFIPANPMDVWVSKNGKNWEQVSDSPWNANDPSEIKYDFAALVVRNTPTRGARPSILTFGGDRETFDFTDPNNYLNVDNDVWRFSLPPR